MTTAFVNPYGIAFRHIVEDGLTVLKRKPIAESRRKYVVDSLFRYFAAVCKGLELVSRNQLLSSTSEVRAFESFSLIKKQIGPKVDDKRIQDALSTFESLGAAGSLSDAKVKSAREILEELLASMESDGDSGLPLEPAEFRLSGF